ncbi:MAG: homoserine dehydrogenase [Deltaproteobacteria bacterium]|nr:homoserine dehydrogenase [Deltaproteobacteria bacterium]
MKNSKKTICIGMAGFGTVGQQVWKLLKEHRQLLSARLGAELKIVKVLVRSPHKKRLMALPKELLTQDSADLFSPEIDLVLELTGQVALAKKLAKSAFALGKAFVTANKALMAEHGLELSEQSLKKGVDLCFEASVAGGIPILRSLREGLAANRIQSLYGILNGTCNYILTEMEEKGADYQQVLEEAQRLGYAEANPRLDVGGWDAAHKLALLSSLAFGAWVDYRDFLVQGIQSISALDLEMANRFDYSIKLLGIAKDLGGKLQMRVQPTMIPKTSLLASVRGVLNAVAVEGDFVGPALFYGQGAGGAPTASAVVGDLVAVGRRLVANRSAIVPPFGLKNKLNQAKLTDLGELRSPYYCRFQAIDRAGVLAKITQILGKHSISLASVYQPLRHEGKKVPIIILTHEAKEKDIQKAHTLINRLREIPGPNTLIRVEEECP